MSLEKGKMELAIDDNDYSIINLEGMVEIPVNITISDFNNLFLDFIEENGFYFCGAMKLNKEEL